MRLQMIRKMRKTAPTAQQICDDEDFIKDSKIETIDPILKNAWDMFFDDMDLHEEIQKDIRRTRSDLHFFCMPIETRDRPQNE